MICSTDLRVREDSLWCSGESAGGRESFEGVEPVPNMAQRRSMTVSPCAREEFASSLKPRSVSPMLTLR